MAVLGNDAAELQGGGLWSGAEVREDVVVESSMNHWNDLKYPLERSLEIERAVSRALGKRPRESLEDAARRIMTGRKGHAAWRVAHEVLHGSGGMWDRLERAAAIAGRHLTKGQP